MPLGRWFLLIGLMMGLGMLRVAQQNALVVSGYALGTRAERLHDQDVQMEHLRADVLELTSPVHLADVAREQRMKFVAWTSVAPVKSIARLNSSEEVPATPSPAHMVAMDTQAPSEQHDPAD